MNIYVGSYKKSLKLGDSSFMVNSPSSALVPTFNGIVLKTSEGYVLLDSNSVYLTAKED